jgi:hypothetical protein
MTFKNIQKFNIIIMVVFLLFSENALKAETIIQMEQNIDRPGMDYKNFDLSTPDPGVCKSACENDSLCKAFTFVRPGIQGSKARCWLKKSVPNPVASNCCISGIKRPDLSEDIGLEYNTDRPGRDYYNFELSVSDPSLCRQSCINDPKCKAFTYVKPGVQGSKARCWLKSGVPSERRNNCCVSGIKLTKSPSVAGTKKRCPTSYKYLRTYPKDRENGWSDNLQGVTNDGNNWFFTQTKTLWKFPVTHDLNKKVTKSDPSKRILKVGIPSDLVKKNYNHFGDLDYYKGYLFVPVTGLKKKWVTIDDEKKLPEESKQKLIALETPPIISVFRASDLQYIGSSPIEQEAGWCAINPLDGLLYTSKSEISYDKPICLYSVHIQGNNVWVTKIKDRQFRLYDESGKPLILKNMQGGAFSLNNCLYLTNGYYKGSTKETGIMVFNAQTGRRIAHSTNGYGPFNYEYHHSGTDKLEFQGEEPEGITLWDLDSKATPDGQIQGQLHVIMVDNDADTDDLYFKHYRILDK